MQSIGASQTVNDAVKLFLQGRPAFDNARRHHGWKFFKPFFFFFFYRQPGFASWLAVKMDKLR